MSLWAFFNSWGIESISSLSWKFNELNFGRLNLDKSRESNFLRSNGGNVRNVDSFSKSILWEAGNSLIFKKRLSVDCFIRNNLKISVGSNQSVVVGGCIPNIGRINWHSCVRWAKGSGSYDWWSWWDWRLWFNIDQGHLWWVLFICYNHDCFDALWGLGYDFVACC